MNAATAKYSGGNNAGLPDRKGSQSAAAGTTSPENIIVTPSDLLNEYSSTQHKLVGKYRRLKANLDKQGVFSAEVNAIRARTQLQVELRNVTMGTLRRRVAEKKGGSHVESKIAEQRRLQAAEQARQQHARTRVGMLETDLNCRMDEVVTKTNDMLDGRRLRRRTSKVRDGLRRTGSRVIGRRDSTASLAGGPPGKGTGGDGTSTVNTTFAFGANTVDKFVGLPVIDGVTPPATATNEGLPTFVPTSGSDGAKRHSISFAGSVLKPSITNDVWDPSAEEADHQGGPPPVDQAGAKDQASEEPPPSQVLVLPTTDLAPIKKPPSYCPAEWVQKAFEHFEYPIADESYRKRKKVRDESLRKGDGAKRDALTRYKTPMARELTDAKFKRAWQWQNAAISTPAETLFEANYLYGNDLNEKAEAVQEKKVKVPKEEKYTGETSSSGGGEQDDDDEGPVVGWRKRKPKEGARRGENLRGHLHEGHLVALQSVRHVREETLEWQSHVHEELEKTKGVMHPSHHLGMLLPFHEKKIESSDDEADSNKSEDDDDDIFDRVARRNSFSATFFRKEYTEGEEACEVMEAAVVVLCDEVARKGAFGGTRNRTEVAAIRNIVIQTGATLAYLVSEECTRRLQDDSDIFQVDRRPKPQTTNANVLRIMRSWIKAVETLLTFDLGLVGRPFTAMNAEHAAKFARHYAVLMRKLSKRRSKLYNRWLENKVCAVNLQKANEQRSDWDEEVQRTAAEVIGYFDQLSNVNTDDLASLGRDQANAAYKAKSIAAEFLGRFKSRLPPVPDALARAMSATKVSLLEVKEAEEAPSERAETEETPEEEPPSRRRSVAGSSLGRSVSRSQPDATATPTTTVAGSTRAATPATASRGAATERPSPADQALVVHRNHNNEHLRSLASSVGAAGQLAKDERERQYVMALENAKVTRKGIGAYINIFHDCERDMAFENVSEATERQKAISYGLQLNLYNLYVRMCSQQFRTQFKAAVKKYRNEIQGGEERSGQLEEDLRGGIEAVNMRKNAEERSRALHIVEKQVLIRKYRSANVKDKKLFDKATKEMERTDTWQGDFDRERELEEQEKAKASRQLGVIGSSKPPASGLMSPASAFGANPPHLVENHAGDMNEAASTRTETHRIRKLKLLEGIWQQLRITFQTRCKLYEKWNSKDLKSIDKALKAWRDAAEKVTAREDTIQKIIENEKEPLLKKRGEERNRLFVDFCNLGHSCDVMAKRLLFEVGDTLSFKDLTYQDKMKQDYHAVMAMLRTNTSL